MTDSTPQMGPGGASGAQNSGYGGASEPKDQPPPALAGAGIEGALSAAGPPPAELEGTAPTLRLGDGVAAGVTTWLSNKRITGLWAINQTRNSWVHVDGVGWKKLANNSDSAIESLTMLGAHAREKASVVNYREESDGMIHEASTSGSFRLISLSRVRAARELQTVSPALYRAFGSSGRRNRRRR